MTYLDIRFLSQRTQAGHHWAYAQIPTLDRCPLARLRLCDRLGETRRHWRATRRRQNEVFHLHALSVRPRGLRLGYAKHLPQLHARARLGRSEVGRLTKPVALHKTQFRERLRRWAPNYAGACTHSVTTPDTFQRQRTRFPVYWQLEQVKQQGHLYAGLRARLGVTMRPIDPLLTQGGRCGV